MRVTVELQAYLDKYSPDGQAIFSHELPDSATVQALLRQLNMPDEMAGVIIVNGASGDFSDTLQDGDRIILIPPLQGGR